MLLKFFGYKGYYGFLNQYCFANFEIDGVKYNNVEQYVQAQKAKLFGDQEAYQKIMQTRNGILARELGEKVNGFNQDAWNNVFFKHLYQGNLAKFSQNEELKQKLFDMDQDIFVFCDKNDPILGIGLAFDDCAAVEPLYRKGKNLLGISLMLVRSKLK